MQVDAELKTVGCLAIVTGANKGIGFACVERLCEELGDRASIVLTSRNVELGQAAVAELQQRGHKPIYHQLDVSDEKSIEALTLFVRERGGCDILINNAGIAFKLSSPEPFAEQARKTTDLNYRGTKNTITKMLPLMKAGGRVIQVSSQAGQLSGRACADRFLRHDLSVEELDSAMDEFVAAAEAGTVVQSGFWSSAYGVSKMGVTQLTRLAAKSATEDGRDLLIVSCCPGLCRTDMTGGNKTKSLVSFALFVATWIPFIGKSAYEGADTPVYLALLPRKDFSTYHGMFVADRRVKPF